MDLITRNRQSRLFRPDLFEIGDFVARGNPPLPEGDFLLPVCVNQQSLRRLLSAALLGGDLLYPSGRGEAVALPLLQACEYVDDPVSAACFPLVCDDEDTYSDDYDSFLDGIIDNLMEGGVIRAIGYLITESGRVVVETGLRVIALTFIGVAVGAVISILVPGSVPLVASVAAGSVVELVVDTGIPSNVIKLVEVIVEVAA